MPNKYTEELRALTDLQLVERVDEAHHELFNLRFRMATRQQTNNQEMGKVRRRIARLKTLQTERTLGLQR
jgi:large subunit ribosomal protein L29